MSPQFNLKFLKALLSSLFLTLLFLSGWSQGTCTGTITIDGHTSDWINFITCFPTHAYSNDRNNSDDNQFTQGSKDGNAITSWDWNDGQTNNKGDITNAAAVLYVDPGNSHYILAFAGDRAVNNGDAAIGFWFFKNPVSIDTTGTMSPYSGKFTGIHHDSDLLIVSHFTQGGGKANLLIYMWKGSGLVGPITTDSAAVNLQQESVPIGQTSFLGYGSTMYPIGDFFEGMIDLTYLKISPCFANFLLETRNSQSLTASLQDLTFGSFSQSVNPPTAGNNTRCTAGVVTLTATAGTGGTIKWYETQTSSTVIHQGATFTPTLTSTTTYYASYSTSGGCESSRTPITGTIKPGATKPIDHYIAPTCTQNLFIVEVTNATSGRKYELLQLNANVYTQTASGGTVTFTGLTVGQGYSVIEITTDGCTSTVTECGTGFGAHTPSTYTTLRKAQPQVEDVVQQPVVTALPNPFNDRLKFLIKSPVSGEGSLDLYNMLGQNVRNIYRGYVEKDALKTIEYSVPYTQRTNLIYLFTIGKYKTSGKLIGIK
jgi:hypothetical protein